MSCLHADLDDSSLCTSHGLILRGINDKHTMKHDASFDTRRDLFNSAYRKLIVVRDDVLISVCIFH